MDISDRTEVAKRLAETYNEGRYEDAWERVQEHRRVVEYIAEHPQRGSTAAASALDLPRSRIRPWMDDGAKPDPVRAIEIAERHGWLDLSWGEPPFTGLNVLVAWIFAGGSITVENWRPHFAATDTERPCVKVALETARLSDLRIEREGAGDRATEVVPRTDATVLGRLLVTLGAPRGSKHDEKRLKIPLYLAGAPRETRLSWARTYVWLRGTELPDRPNTPVQITEERHGTYRTSLQQLLNGLVQNAVHGDSNSIQLSAGAATLLYRPPELCDFNN